MFLLVVMHEKQTSKQTNQVKFDIWSLASLRSHFDSQGDPLETT